ncbi:hypothetical protein ACP4OV_028597 [Aristida adscensionis]
MDLTNTSAVWFALALVFIAAVITKIARQKVMFNPVCNNPRPPVLKGGSIIVLLYVLVRKGLRAMIHDQHAKLGSVFTVSLFGLEITFLAEPEVLGHFYQGLDSEISHSGLLEFTVPMIGKEVGYGVDIITRAEQGRFYSDALKPSKLRCHAGPMLQEVEAYFARWGQQGVVDLKQELQLLLTLIAGRCLVGTEVREKMFGEVFTLFHQLLDNGFRLTSVLFPYAPTPANRRRDRARAKLSGIFTEIVRSRNSSNGVENDVLQSLIDSKYGDGRPTTEAEVAGMIISWLVAAKHTSSAASTWTGVHLLSNAWCLTASLEEQKKIIRKYGDNIGYNVLLEMDFLHCCIKEALRIHPPAPVFFRKVHKNFSVQTKEGMKYEISKGHTIVNPVLFNCNIPDIYKDPDVYNPNRFGPRGEEDKVSNKFSYTAFGGGRHTCIGEGYAYMQIKMIWSYLLRNFELKLESPFPETDWRKIILEPKGKVMVSYKRRSLPST